MASIGYLRQLIQENPETPIVDVLNDDEFLDELRIKDESFLKYLAKHISSLKIFIIEEPPLDADYKRSFKFPFLTCEIFTKLPEIFQLIDKANFIENEKYLIKYFFSYFTQTISENSILPGYLEKILAVLTQTYPGSIVKYLISDDEIINNLMMNVDSDSVMNIIIDILNIEYNPAYNPDSKDNFKLIKQSLIQSLGSFLELNICLYLELSSKFENNVEETLRISQPKQRLDNYFTILTKFITNLNRTTDVGSIDRSLIDILNHSFNKMLINQYSRINNLNENTVKVIEFVNGFLAGVFKHTFLMNAEEITFDSIQKEINEAQLTNNIGTTVTDTPKKLSLAELLNGQSKSCVASLFINNFELITNASMKSLQFYEENRKIPNLSGSFILPVSTSYLNYLDILLITILDKNKDIVAKLKNNRGLFNMVLGSFLKHSNNSFLQNKILKINEIILFNDCYKDIKSMIIENEILGQFMNSEIKFDDLYNAETKSLNSCRSYAYIMKLLNYYYISIKSSDNFKVVISNERLQELEICLGIYLEILSSDLLSKEIQASSDLKIEEEQLTINTGEGNFYDSKAFLSTTKIMIENSKKTKARLMEIELNR